MVNIFQNYKQISSGCFYGSQCTWSNSFPGSVEHRVDSCWGWDTWAGSSGYPDNQWWDEV